MRSKKIKGMVLVLVFLIVGFAAVTGTLVINGTSIFGANDDDYSIYFSEAILDGEDKTNVIISEDGLSINFASKELSSIGDSSVLEYEVTNASLQYDAEVTVVCEGVATNAYTSFDNTLENQIIPAQSTANGVLTITLDKVYAGDGEIEEEYTCTIIATAVEREDIPEDLLVGTEYYINGYLVDEYYNMLGYDVVVAYGSEAYYTTADVRGFFHLSGLTGGDYDIYVISDKTIEEVNGLSEEEIAGIANYTGSFNTSKDEVVSEVLLVEDPDIGPGNPETHTIELDANGGIGENVDILVVNGRTLGKTIEFGHETLVHTGWKNGETDYTSNTLIELDNDDLVLYAQYGNGVAAIATKEFRSIQSAVNYASETEETEVDVLVSHTVEDDIVVTKNIILDLNGYEVDMLANEITNNGTLTIDNGVINADGQSGIYNIGNLTLNSALIFNKTDNLYTLDEAALALYNTNTGNVVINGSTINNEVSTHITRALRNYGVLTINGGNIKSAGTTYGIFECFEGSTTNIYGGTFDGSQSNGNILYEYANSTVNIGSADKDVTFIGNSENNSYILLARGDMNITEGNIRAQDGALIGVFGTLEIGESDKVPSIYGATSEILMEVRDGGTTTVNNANVYTYDASFVNVTTDGELNINNINSTLESTTKTMRMFINNGILNIYDGNVVAEGTTNGIFQINSGSTTNIYGGTFDGTNADGVVMNAAANSTVNIGASGKEVKFIGNTKYYGILVSGVLNILEGTVYMENTAMFNVYGKLNIGESDKVPAVYGSIGYSLISARDGGVITINNGNIYADDGRLGYIYAGGEMNINNVNASLVSESSTVRMFDNSGTLNIYGGNVVAEGTATGIFSSNSGSTTNIYGGTFDGTNADGVVMNAAANSTVNIGASGKEVKFIGNAKYYGITVSGVLNVLEGTVYMDNTAMFSVYGTLNIGESDKVPIIHGATNDVLMQIRDGSTVNINNGDMYAYNYYFAYINAGGEMNVSNVNATLESTSTTVKMFENNGTLNIYGGNVVAEGTATGIFSSNAGSVTNVYGGTFDGTSVTGGIMLASPDSIVNIGVSEKEVRFIGSANYYCVTTSGVLNVLEGSVYIENTVLFNIYGTLNIGESEKIPTIHGATGDYLVEIRDGSTININNGNIYTYNASVGTITATAVVNVYNGNVTMESTSTNLRLFNIYGTLNMYDGNLVSKGTSYGIMECLAGSTMNIYGGTLNSTAATSAMIAAYETSTINIGSTEKNVKLIGTHNMYSIYSYGEVNFLEGNLYMESGPFMAVAGTLNIGASDKLPTVYGAAGETLIGIVDGGIVNINNGNLYSYNANIGRIYAGGKMNINNGNLYSYDASIGCIYAGGEMNIYDVNAKQENTTAIDQMFYNDGTLNMYDGEFVAKGSSYGILQGNSGSVNNIYGGILDGREALYNTTFILYGATINIGELNSTKELQILGRSSGGYPTVVINGTGNIYSGYISVNDSTAVLIGGSEGSEAETPSGVPNVNMYGGELVNATGDHATVDVQFGNFAMSGGTITNTTGHYTIYNADTNTGTVTQTGGTSANNYNVTVG